MFARCITLLVTVVMAAPAMALDTTKLGQWWSLGLEEIMPLIETSDDPEYRAIYAEILAARGDSRAAMEAERAAAAYELLLARRPEAYADHAAAFFMGLGNRPQRAVELASANWKLRDTPRSRRLLAKALGNARRVSPVQGIAA